MPLKRLNEFAEIDNLIGVDFVMVDEAQGTQWKCRATYETLCDRAAFDGEGRNWVRAWENHMGTIEALASTKYDAVGMPKDGSPLLIETLELTPLSNAKSCFQARG